MGKNRNENFPVASLLLPSRFRRPIALIYRFAREADDVADEGDLPAPARLAQLGQFREQLSKIERGVPPDIAWFAALAAVIREHDLPVSAFADLLSAFAQDVTQKRYANVTGVLDYCQRSANPVGRLLLHLFGSTGEANFRWSDSICSALQLVNFWQDVAIDYAKGRVYLPQDEMRRCGVTEQHIAGRLCDDAWRTLIRSQIDRARGRGIGTVVHHVVHLPAKRIERRDRAAPIFRQEQEAVIETRAALRGFGLTIFVRIHGR